MPLSPLRHFDRWIWSGTKNGCFTIRSAYHFEMHRRAQSLGECSSIGEQHVFWKAIWQIEAPAILKNFAWKISNNLLPTKHNFDRKRIGHDPQFPFCLVNPETMCHILLACSSYVAVWQECSRKIQKLALEDSDGIGFLRQHIAKLDAEELVEVLTVERLIWLHRNSYVFSSDFTPPLHLVMSAKEMVETYKQVNSRIASSAIT
jgi:hypothetical protein